MNILYYCDEYPPCRNGGIGTVTKTVAETLVMRGHQVFVVGICRKDSGCLPDFSEINGVKIYRIKQRKKSIFDKIMLFFDKDFELKKLLNDMHNFIENLTVKEKIDIVELPDYDIHNSELHKIIKWKKFSAPAICRIHGSTSFVNQIYYGKIPLHIFENDRRRILSCSKIYAVSHYTAGWVRENFKIDAPIDVIYNPIENAYFQNIALPYPVEKKILYFGKLTKLKGFYSLIEAYKIVAEQEKESVLCIVGANSEQEIENAKKLFPKNLYNRLIFRPFMNKAVLQKEIDSAYCCVLPSYAENFSMAALEVLARGRLLIYTERCSGAELVADGENGFLVNPDNFAAFAEKILFALNNPVIIQKIAEKGYADCKSRFSIDVIIPQMERAYTEFKTKGLYN